MDDNKGRWTIRTSDWALVDNEIGREYPASSMRVAFSEDKSRACFWFNRKYLCDVPVNKKFAARVADKIESTSAFISSEFELNAQDIQGNAWALQVDSLKSDNGEISLIGARFELNKGNTEVFVYGSPAIVLKGDHQTLLTSAKMAAIKRLYSKLPDDGDRHLSNFQRQQQSITPASQTLDDSEDSVLASIIAFIAWVILITTIIASIYLWPKGAASKDIQLAIVIPLLLAGIFYWAVTLGVADLVKNTKSIAWLSKQKQR